MAFVDNPLYAGDEFNKQRQANIASGMKSLGDIFGGVDPATQLKAQTMGASMAKDKSEAALKSDELAGRQGMGSIFADPSLHNPDGSFNNDAFRAKAGDIISMAARAHMDDPGKAVMRPYLAMTGNGEDMRRGLVSAGQMPDVNTALNMGESNSISARDAGEEYHKAMDVQGLKNEGDVATQKALADALKGQLGDIFTTPAGAAPSGAPNPGEYGPPAPHAEATPAGPDASTIADKITAVGVQTGNPKLISMGSMLSDRAARGDMRKSQQAEGEVQKYAKSTEDLAPLAESAGALFQNLSSYPQGADLPGFGATASMPDWLLSDEGRKLRQDVASVGNAVIKARSGQAVSTQEAERLANELGYSIQGDVLHPLGAKTDEALKVGVGNVLRQLKTTTHNKATVLGPDALDLYKTRGGPVPPDYFDKMDKMGLATAPPEAVQELMKDPTPDAMAEFDAVFGQGAAKQALGAK